MALMNDVRPILDAIAFVLAVLLALIGLAAAYRYRDPRFAFVGTALAVLGAVSAVGALDLLWPGSIPGGTLGLVPVLLLLAAEVLFYLSFVAARRGPSRPPSP